MAKKDSQQKRTAVVPPEFISKDMTLFDYLSLCQPPLEKRIAEISIVKNKVPSELHDEAVQEIYMKWATQYPDVEAYKPGQIAAYAYRMASNECLRIRRDLGSPVRLPGCAFRTKSDGTQYINPGHLAAPLDWSELEQIFNADDNTAVNPAAASAMGEIYDAMTDNAASEVDEEEQMRHERLELLMARKNDLTEDQLRIMIALTNGEKLEDIAQQMNMKQSVLKRSIFIAASVIGKI